MSLLQSVAPSRDHPTLTAIFHVLDKAPINILWYWLIGTGWASTARDWVLDAWPSIDLDVGPTSTKLTEQRRARIMFLLLFIVLPILCSLSYDLLKAAS